MAGAQTGEQSKGFHSRARSLMSASDRSGRSGTSFFRQPFAPILTTFAVCAIVVMTITWLSAGPTIISTVWLASGLAVAVWLRGGRGLSYDLAFGGMTALALMTGEILVGNPPDRAIIFAGLNFLEIVLALVIIRRFLPRLDVGTVKGQMRLLCCVFVATLPSAVLCAFMLRHGALDGPIAGMKMWWLGHGIGTVLFAAAGLAFSAATIKQLKSPRALIEFVVFMAALVALALYTFSDQGRPLGFIILPVLLLIAVRLGVVGTAIALVVVTVIAVKGTVADFGPFSGMDLDDRLEMVQMLILFGYAPVLIVAALLQERDSLAERARHGRIKAEQASVAKSRLLANVAHEIKSPVSGMIGIAEMWSSGHLGKVDQTQVEMAQMMVRTGRQIEALSHDLLDVAKAESGAVRIELRAVDVHGALHDAAAGLKLMPEAQGLEISVIEGEMGLMVMADSQRLAQILANLGSNAAKYGRAGGKVRLRSVRLNDETVRLLVEDDGPGLTPEKQAQLFEPFNRLGLERSSIEGHGIGLALSKRLAELQGGQMGVISQVGEGAAFWLDLPLVK